MTSVMTEQCGTPKCPRKHMRNSKFCKECRANLRRIKKEFDSNPKRLFSQRSDQKKNYKPVPTCTILGCFDERLPGTPFCAGHQGEQTDD